MLQTAAVGIHQEQLEVATVADVLVRCEDDLLAVGSERRGETGAAEIRDPLGVLAIGVGDEDLHFHGRSQVLGQFVFVILHSFRSGRMAGAPDQLLTVPREERAAVVADAGSDLACLAAVHVADPQVQIAAALGGPHHFPGLPVHGGFRVVSRMREHLLDNLSVERGLVHLKRFVDWPQIALAAVDAGRTWRAGFVRGRVNDVLAVGIEISAGGAALARRHQVLVGSVGVHHKDLIALVGVARGLENDLGSVRRPIGFRVGSSGGQLLDGAKMFFFGRQTSQE